LFLFTKFGLLILDMYLVFQDCKH